jgi:hypothetical protein
VFPSSEDFESAAAAAAGNPKVEALGINNTSSITHTFSKKEVS